MNGFQVTITDGLRPSVALARWKTCAKNGSHKGPIFLVRQITANGDSEGPMGDTVETFHYCAFCEHTTEA